MKAAAQATQYASSVSRMLLDKQKTPVKNCKGSHAIDSRACDACKREKEVTKVKYTRDIFFPEASRIIETNFPT